MARKKSPLMKLNAYVSEYIGRNGLRNDLLKYVPRKWEKYGDMVIFQESNFVSTEWLKLPVEFWLGICNVLNCKRLALKGVIRSDSFRTPSVTLLVGSDSWINHKDNGILFSWDIYKNMFSAGNAPERHRIASLNCNGEVIVDLFAGIGYFTLPYLVHAKAEFVHACEWNPMAVVALKKNLKINKVEEKCAIYEGDNKDAGIVGVADRVNLGLIPSSELSWPTACRALKPCGGILVVHNNVETLKPYNKCQNCPLEVVEEKCDGIKWKHQNWRIWADHVMHSITDIMSSIHISNYVSNVVNVHFVKSYAPHVDHIVLDIRTTKI